MKGKGEEINNKTHLLKIRPSHYDKEFQYMTTHPRFIHSFAACVRNNFHGFSPNQLCLCRGRRAITQNMAFGENETTQRCGNLAEISETVEKEQP